MRQMKELSTKGKGLILIQCLIKEKKNQLKEDVAT